MLLRRVEAADVPARVRVILDPRAGFGRHKVTRLNRDDAAWTGRTGPLHLRWSGRGTSATVRADGGLELELTIEPGHRHDLVLEVSDQPLPGEPADPGSPGHTTERLGGRVPSLQETSLATRDTRHSYAVLAGLTSTGGGMVAAATTSLPERARPGRNYDYRYVWIRDQCYAGQAVAAAGPYPLLDDAVGFVAARLLDDGAQLAPAYTLDRRPRARPAPCSGCPATPAVRHGR